MMNYNTYFSRIVTNTHNPKINSLMFVLLQIAGYVVAGKRRVNASCSISTAWMPTLRGEIFVGNGKELKTLDMNTSYGKQNLNISASLNNVDKVQDLLKPLKRKRITPFLCMTSMVGNSYFRS